MLEQEVMLEESWLDSDAVASVEVQGAVRCKGRCTAVPDRAYVW